MSKILFPLANKLGLETKQSIVGMDMTNLKSEWVVSAYGLEVTLQNATVFYGSENIGGGMTYADIEQEGDTHRGLLVCVEEIQHANPGPKKIEFETTVTNSQSFQKKIYEIENKDLAPLVGKRVRVTVEELP